MKEIFKRDLYLEKIRPYYDIDLIKVLSGVRRSGKSKILEMIMQEIIDIYHNEENIIYINFEDDKHLEIQNSFDLRDLMKTLFVNEKKYYIFFDEIQHVKDFEKNLASLKLTKNCSIFVTGSNSTLLNGELASLLVGRVVEFNIFPFTYKESVDYLTYLGQQIPLEFFNNYLKFGGFPQRFDFVKEEHIYSYLNGLYNSIIEKDVYRKDSNVSKEKFMMICSYVLANCGQNFSSSNVSRYYNSVVDQNKKLSPQTVLTYVDKMVKAFLITKSKRYLIKGKEILKTFEKQYAVDVGLRIINTNTIDFESTFFLENIIYNELLSRDYEVFTGKIYNGEVDFVVIKQGKRCYIQVSYSIRNIDVRNREFNAFSSIRDNYPKYVLSLDRIDYSKNGIVHLNIEDFLLKIKDIVLL
jgi:predicted AAA+ superfamily ATPase